MTLDELMSEETKLKSQKIPVALFIGALVGVAIWSATHQGGFVLTIGLLLGAFWLSSRFAKTLKSIQAELGRRDTVG
ncbi:hypothetical protein [Spirosoma koreense]